MSESTKAPRVTAASVLLAPTARVRRRVRVAAAGIALLLSGMVAIGNGWRYTVVVVPLLWLVAVVSASRLMRNAEVRLTPGAIGRRDGRGRWVMTGRSRVAGLVEVPLGLRPDGSQAQMLMVLDDTGRRAAGARRDLLSAADADELVAWAEHTAGIRPIALGTRAFVRTYPRSVPRWRRIPHADSLGLVIGLALLVVVAFLLGRWLGLS